MHFTLDMNSLKRLESPAVLLRSYRILCFLLLASTVNTLSSSIQTNHKPVQKVAIVGSGIAGLSLAHALENSPSLRQTKDGLSSSPPIQATIYDSRSSLNFQAGAGVQLNGGMTVLKMINPQVQRAVADASLPLKEIETRAKPWFGDDAKTTFDTLLNIELEKCIRRQGGTIEKSLIVDDEVMVYTIMRGALQEALMNTLPTDIRTERIKFDKTLTEITGKNDGAYVGFQDGKSDGPFDLIVGCDGVNSAVKQYVSRGSITPGGKSEQTLYSGIRIQYAVQDDEQAVREDGALLRQYFGDGAYSLAGTYGNGPNRSLTKAAYLIKPDKDYIGPFPKPERTRSSNSNIDDDENTDWSQDKSVNTGEKMLGEIQECGVPSLEVGPIIKESDRFFELGVYFHSPFHRWTREIPNSGGGYCTLGGDAAHAMPPFLGQGSNQAIQDAYCLAAKLYEYNNNNNGSDGENLQAYLKRYETIRWKPTASISLKAFLLGYLESGKGFIGKFRDAFFRTCGILGIAEKIYFGAAVPAVLEEEEPES
mmetsp:Transcript_8082/g.11747  ORF Transcript_8082/g.11747 Transcript_8082/m.11747 type:complete len:536 (-) Transcript_8082:86-1693(-)